MNPSIATLICITGIIVLVRWDAQGRPYVSSAVWLSVVWFVIGASRAFSQWFGVAQKIDSPDQYLEGSPLDRLLLSILLAIGLVILARRRGAVLRILRANWPIVAFVVFAGISAIWSDFPLVAFKRWTKLLGNVAMVLIVLTERNRLEAIKQSLVRSGFILIPVSVLFIKYYPEFGRTYHQFTWAVFYRGVSSDKNGLGVLCFIFGLASVWRLMETLRTRDPNRKKVLLAHAIVIAMTIWLFTKADSVTSMSCFAFGTCMLIATSIPAFAKKRLLIHLMVTVLISFTIATLFLDVGGGLLENVGRNSTLTGRTVLWAELLQMNSVSVLGTGFESFWLGDRAKYFWDKYWWQPNQAHNGYLEMLINLGWLGVALLFAMVVWGYRGAIRDLRKDEFGKLRLAYLVLALIYNITEASFKVMHPVWIIFFMCVIYVPERRMRPEPAAVLEDSEVNGIDHNAELEQGIVREESIR